MYACVPRYLLASKNDAGHLGYFCSIALMPLERESISFQSGDPE